MKRMRIAIIALMSGIICFTSAAHAQVSYELALKWAMNNTGPKDCSYSPVGGEAANSNNRAQLMSHAIKAAVNGQCAAAFQMSLLTACHNPTDTQTILAAGPAKVCKFLGGP